MSSIILVASQAHCWACLTAHVAPVFGDGGVPEGVLLVLREGLLVAVRHGAGALLELGLQRRREGEQEFEQIVIIIVVVARKER